jgi:hypothetical protein
MVTREYGALWVGLAHEAKGSARLPRTAPSTSASASAASAAAAAAVLNVLRTRVGVHPVEVIGAEGIAAGEVVGTRERVLVHSKCDVGTGTVALTVRAGNRTLSDNTLKECVTQLSA